jgi:signal peptidase I
MDLGGASVDYEEKEPKPVTPEGQETEAVSNEVDELIPEDELPEPVVPEGIEAEEDQPVVACEVQIGQASEDDAQSEEAAAEKTGPAVVKKGKSFMGVVLEYLQSIVMAFLIAMVIMAFLGRSYMVEGSSMEQTLFNNERVLVQKISYYVSTPTRGDIVVLMNPRQQKYNNWFLDTFGFVKDIFVANMATRPYIKRIIGVAGDTIEVKGGKTYLNEQMLEEPYVTEEIWWDFGPTQVAEGYVFVMGDNRNHSDDSRGSVGFLEIDRILGKAVVRFWPLNKLTVFTKPEIFRDK